MKYIKTKNLYRASHVVFDATNITAWSWEWWQFVQRLPDGRVVFNNYSYSASTNGHQSKVRGLLSQLGIKIDLYVRSRVGLQQADWIQVAIDDLTYEINVLRDAINKPRSHATKNEERSWAIGELISKQIELQRLLPQTKEYTA
jgi:hypothetical protein